MKMRNWKDRNNDLLHYTLAYMIFNYAIIYTFYHQENNTRIIQVKFKHTILHIYENERHNIVYAQSYFLFLDRQLRSLIDWSIHA